ncbi:MAG: barnase inhibitor [Clostridiales bacterium]|nr:barnase inhibitor [Clostridiales bacterium]
MKAIIEGINMLTREEAHAELGRALGFPDYYGANLDALFDLASTMTADAELNDVAVMLNALGVYGCKLVQTLFEAAQENARFTFTLRTMPDDIEEV